MLLYYSGGNGPHSGARSDFIALATAQRHAFVGLTPTTSFSPTSAVAWRKIAAVGSMPF